jgi:hypothetical protein
MEKKYIKALDVKDFGHDLYVGDTIKIYGEETTITGFCASYNDGLEKWETIIYTIGRAEPFERSLGVIEILEDQPRSFKERSPFYAAQQGQTDAVWVKSTDRLPGYTTPVKWRDGNDYSHSTDGEIALINMAKPFLVNWEWLDESPQNLSK